MFVFVCFQKGWVVTERRGLKKKGDLRHELCYEIVIFNVIVVSTPAVKREIVN